MKVVVELPDVDDTEEPTEAVRLSAEGGVLTIEFDVRVREGRREVGKIARVRVALTGMMTALAVLGAGK